MSDTYKRPVNGWVCFHCGETFVDHDKAQEHFGHYTIAPPTCVIGGKEYRQDEIEAFLLMRKRAEAAEAERDRMEARVGELSEALEFIKEIEVEVMFRGHGEDYVKATFPKRHWGGLCKALAGDGSALADVIYRHRKGGLYRIVARGRLESDLTPVVIYQALAGYGYWVRPAAEFDDGRFEALDGKDG